MCLVHKDIKKKLFSIISRHLQAIDKVEKLDKWAPHESTERNDLITLQNY